MTAPTSDRHRRTAAHRARRLAGRATAGLRPLPDAIVIGAMKAGSTTAYTLLLEHPRVRGPAHKEVHFLDRHFERGVRWYRAQFPLALGSRTWVAVESTPYYLSYPLAPARLRTVVPDAKLVVLLRDPVERAISQWKQRTREGRERRALPVVLEQEGPLSPDDTAELAARDPEAYRSLILTHGDYAAQLRRWFAAFDRARMLIVDSRQLFDDTPTTMVRMFDHLGLEPCAVGDGSARNVGDDRTVDQSTRRALREHYRSANDDLFELLDTRFDW